MAGGGCLLGKSHLRKNPWDSYRPSSSDLLLVCVSIAEDYIMVKKPHAEKVTVNICAFVHILRTFM